MPSILVVGANRGIGLEFARQYTEAGWTVHASTRGEDDGSLRELGANLLTCDVTDPTSLAHAAQQLQGVPIDVLIANAGVSGNLALTPAEVTASELLGVMAVNTYGPLATAAAFLPNLQLGQRKIACATSSLMSSIAANDWSTQHVYRASKAGLNAVWRTLAEEWQPLGIACVLLRPGYVKTRMTSFQGIEPEESVSGMRRVVDSLTLADTGRLIGYDGLDVPW